MQSFDQDSFEEVEDQIEFLVANMFSPRCPINGIGRFYEDYFYAVRAHAILYLLLDKDSNSFHHDLNVVAYARRHLLNRYLRAGYADRYMCSGLAEGFMDAIAASNFDLALDIALLSPSIWEHDYEYEDDFCYARFLHIYLIDSKAALSDMDVLLKQFEKVLQGTASARFDLCRAFSQKDNVLFTNAFNDLLIERKGELSNSATLADEFVISALNTSIFVEGLAILRLADRAGFTTEQEYQGCPSLARLTSITPPDDPMPAL
jgi:hypothetical protein